MFSKYIIKYYFYICTNMPIDVDIERAFVTQ